MNYLRTNNIGVDKQIAEIQNILYNELIVKWGSIDAYGRVYKNINIDSNGKDIIIPQVYKSQGEYSNDVFLNDNVNGTFFFINSDETYTSDEITYVTDIKIVFQLNLQKTYNDRNDSLAQNDVLLIIKNKTWGKFEIKNIQTGLKNILSEFSIDGIKNFDFHPYHTFSVNGKLTYYLKEC